MGIGTRNAPALPEQDRDTPLSEGGAPGVQSLLLNGLLRLVPVVLEPNFYLKRMNFCTDVIY